MIVNKVLLVTALTMTIGVAVSDYMGWTDVMHVRSISHTVFGPR